MKGKKFDTKNLDKSTAWIAGSKLPGESYFFTQIVYTLKHKQHLWDYWLNNGLDFYFEEVEIFTTVKKDYIPF